MGDETIVSSPEIRRCLAGTRALGRRKVPLAPACSEKQRARVVYRRYDSSEQAQRKRDPKNPGVRRMRSERWPITGDILGSRFPLTDHDEIDYRLIQREARWTLGCRNRLSGANVESP